MRKRAADAAGPAVVRIRSDLDLAAIHRIVVAVRPSRSALVQRARAPDAARRGVRERALLAARPTVVDVGLERGLAAVRRDIVAILEAVHALREGAVARALADRGGMRVHARIARRLRATGRHLVGGDALPGAGLGPEETRHFVGHVPRHVRSASVGFLLRCDILRIAVRVQPVLLPPVAVDADVRRCIHPCFCVVARSRASC